MTIPRRSVVLLLLTAPLAGCATLPSSGPVVSEPRRSQPSDPEGAAIDADPPAAGASPSLIIDGFLHAMATYQPGYPAARQYLTEAAKETWDPATGAIVYADGTTPKINGGKASMEAPLVGNLGSDGSFDAVVDETWTHDFDLVKENGEWRINQPPPGVLISRYLFSSGFVRHDIYFLDSARTTLVPDARYIARGNRTPDTVVRLLLAGPSTWLRPSVVSALPSAGLLVSAIPGATEVPTIPFTEVPASAAERSLMCAQVAAVLRQLPDVKGFRITGQGATVDIPEQRADGSIPFSMADRYDPLTTLSGQLFAMSEGHLVRAADTVGATTKAVNGDFGTKTWNASAIAVGTDGVDAALVVGNELFRGPVDGPGAKTVMQRDGMLRPQFTRDGGLWTMTTAGDVWRIDGDKTVQVRAPGLAGRKVIAFRFSPDGQRVAVVTDVNGAREVGLVRIERGADLVVSGWRTVPLMQDTAPVLGATDVGWSSTTSLTVLTGAERPADVIDVDIDGVVLHDDGRSDTWSANSLAVSAPGSRKAVGDSEGYVWLYQDSFQWRRLPGKLTTPAYPG